MNGMNRGAINYVLAIVCIASSLFPYAGAASFDFMNIDIGGRSAAMGGAGAASYGTLEGLAKNPAAFASLPTEQQAEAAYSFYLSSMLWSGAYGYRFDNGIVLAVGARGVIYDPIAAGIPYATGTSTNINALDVAAVAGAACTLSRFIPLPFICDIGMTMGYAYEGLDDISLSAFIVSAGGTAWFIERMFGVSFTVRNLGIAGSPYETIPTAAEFILGGACNLDLAPELKVSIMLDTDIGALAGVFPSVRGGVELTIVRMFFVRAGGVFADHQTDISAGGGVRIPLGATWFTADYSFLTASGIGTRHAVSIAWAFGKR